MSKLQEDLKLIVGIKDLENELEELENKIEILSGRFTAYQQGKNSGTGQDGVNINGPSGDDSATSVEDALDNKDQRIPGGNEDPLLGMDGMYDCETGKEIEIREDGEGIPPPGWSTVNSPPDDGWKLGYVWTIVSGFVRYYGATFSEMISVREGLDGTTAVKYIPGTGGIANTPPAIGDGILFTTTPENPLGGTSYKYAPVVESEPIGTYGQISCSSPIITVPPSQCSITEPPKQMWPIADKFQLIKNKQTGLLEPHPLDPNVPENFQGPQSTVDFCFGDGRTGRREATAAGGFMYYETNEDGDPIDNVLVFDVNGNLLVKANPADIDKYRVNED